MRYEIVNWLIQNITSPLPHVFQPKGSLRTTDAFPVVASLPPKNSVCEPERQNDFRDVKPLVLM